MWPLLLDMTKDESLQSLRCLELEAYAGLVTALRAQGPLNQEKAKILKESCLLLNITQDRHKAEVRRVVNDEKLNTIAYHVSGQRTTSDEWAMEGRRLCPLMPRVAPQTAFSAIADEVADSTSKMNRQLPSPSSTERKRSPVSVTQGVPHPEHNKTVFRVPELPKTEESKKRKLPIGVENSSLAQHLMGSPKMSRIQQIYRQKTKARQKEQHLQMKIKQEQDLPGQKITAAQIVQKFQPKYTVPTSPHTINNSKINVLQNLSIPSMESENIDQIKTEPGYITQKAIIEKPNIILQTTTADGIIKNKPIINNTKLGQHVALKHAQTTIPGSSGDMPKTLKICPTRKTFATKTVPAGQKLIVVSNPQSVTNPSILHRTLTIPFVKNLKNLEKYKIVTPTSSIQLTPISNTITNNLAKHKVVTVRNNAQTVKKVIPLSQLQVLNAKGGIKVLPIGGKIVTKSNTNSTSAPIFIVNAANNISSLTKSTTSTPVLMSSKPEVPDKIVELPELKEEIVDESPASLSNQELENNLEISTENDKQNVEFSSLHNNEGIVKKHQDVADDKVPIVTEITEQEGNIEETSFDLSLEESMIASEENMQEVKMHVNVEFDKEFSKEDSFINEENALLNEGALETETVPQTYGVDDISLMAEEELGNHTDEEMTAFIDDTQVENKEEISNDTDDYNMEVVSSVETEEQNHFNEAEHEINCDELQTETQDLFVGGQQEQSNEEILDSFGIEQPAEIINMSEVNENHEKYVLENPVELENCVQIDPIKHDMESMESECIEN